MSDILLIDKRRLLLLSGATFALSACRSTAPISCAELDNPIDQASCRQETRFKDLPLRLTAGMIVGAAIGAGIAVAFRFDPVVGAIGGAMAAGGAVAVDTYVQYLKEQNGNDPVRMDGMARQHLLTDVGTAKEALADTKTVFTTVRSAFRANDGLLTKHARDVASAEKALLYVKKNVKALNTAHTIYREVGEKGIALKDTASVSNNNDLKYHIDEIEAEERRFFAMLG